MKKNNDIKLKKDVLVKAENLDMQFKIPETKYDTLKERVVNLFKGKRPKYKIFKVLEDINALGTTTVMATHDRDIVDRMKKRVIIKWYTLL